MKHITPIPVRFRDLDSLGHVNNAVFVTYVEMGRIDYFNEAIGKRNNWHEFGTLIAYTSIDYITPIFLHDEVYCHVETTRMGTKSFDVYFELFKNVDGKDIICAKGKNVLVCYDNVKQQTANIPDDWKVKVEEYEGKKY